MKVSAIMPTYNQSEFILEAIESVAPQVEELIVIDDGSTDGTEEIIHENLRRFKSIRISHHTKNRGTAAAINSGFAWAQGDLVTWVSSDNVHHENWRSALESEFRPRVGVVYSGYSRWTPRRDTRLTTFTHYDPNRLINDQNCFFGPSFMIRREVWEKAGPHRGKISHDYDHWLRVEEACQEMDMEIVGLNKSLCLYRAHNKRVTVTRRAQYDAPHWQAEARKRRGVKQP